MDTSPGTPLYNLPLLGEGTGQVESLTSYIVRLARAHYARPRDLIRRVAGEGCPEIAALCYARFFSRYAITVNGLGKYARLFADRFGELTGNPILAHTTLLPWHRLLAPNGSALLAPHPRWCRQCLVEDVQAGKSPYLRLAWSVGLEKYCTQHHALLKDVCPSCGRTQPAIPRVADLLHCDYCHQPLVPLFTTSATIKADQMPQDLRSEKVIAELLALNPLVDPETTHRHFTDGLQRVVMQVANGNRAVFCNAVNLQPRALNGWLAQGQCISLELLLHLCRAVGHQPVSFCIGNSKQRHEQRRKYHSLKKRVEAKGLLLQAIAAPKHAQPLAGIASELGVSRGYLRYWYPRLVRQLVAIRRAAARERTAHRSQKHRDVICAVIEDSLRQGMWPGRKQIELSARQKGFSLLDKDMLDAYQNLLFRKLQGKVVGPT